MVVVVRDAREGGGQSWVVVASGKCWVDGVGERRLLWTTTVLLGWGCSAPPIVYSHTLRYVYLHFANVVR